MGVSLNCNQGNVVKPNFKGSYQRTENGTPYYKTNSGVIAGSVLGGIQSLSIINNLIQKRTTAGLISLTTVIASVGCGAIIDNIRNKNAAKTADEIRQIGLKKAIQMDEHVDIARSGRGYYESNDGAKHGWKLGAVVGLVLGSASALSKDVKEAFNKIGNLKGSKTSILVASVLGTGVLNALGGFIMGKIADHNTNSDARKHA